MPSTTIKAKVKPNARASSIVQGEDGLWLAQLKAPPVDGRANEELVAMVARHFACRRSKVSIKSSGASRMKLITINVE